MNESVLYALAGIIVLGIGAQWIAWRIKIPSILLLLTTGFIAGPISAYFRDGARVIDPDGLLGELLFPIVSISVAIILFEGGLTLQLSELRVGGKVIRNLTTIGALVTFVLASIGAHFICELSWQISLLFGAILVVTGPTVIQPLLRHVRPRAPVGSILKWEGIVIDPIGATLAVLVFEVILASGPQEAAAAAVLGVVKTLVIGIGIGGAGAVILIVVIRRHWVPEFLDNAVTLSIVVVALAGSNRLMPESGLLAVTSMGVILANQRWVAVRHIIEFKENLRVLLISGLFILLAARVELSELQAVGARGAIFVAVLMLVVRPLATLAATFRTDLTIRERLFIAWLAPRGIVAASVASIFTLELQHEGVTEADALVPLTFVVIIGTVAIYGLTASWVARLLGVAKANPQGALIVGAHGWAREIGAALVAEGYDVLLVDTNPARIATGRLDGLRGWYGSILSDEAHDEIDFDGLGRILALTPNGEVNSLAAVHMTEIFGREEIYQLEPREEKGRVSGVPKHLRGRFLFGAGVTWGTITDRVARGAIVKRTKITEEFGWDRFLELYPDPIRLFLKKEDGTLEVFTSRTKTVPQAGQTVIALVDPATDRPSAKLRAQKARAALESADESEPEPDPAEEPGQ